MRLMGMSANGAYWTFSVTYGQFNTMRQVASLSNKTRQCDKSCLDETRLNCPPMSSLYPINSVIGLLI